MLIATVVGVIIAVLVAVGGMLVALFKRGMNEGRLTEILSNLQTIVSDHEARLRMLESHHERRLRPLD